MLNITSLNYADADFYQQHDDVLAWEASIDGDIAKTVADILADVKKRGDTAVIEYTNKENITMGKYRVVRIYNEEEKRRITEYWEKDLQTLKDTGAISH